MQSAHPIVDAVQFHEIRLSVQKLFTGRGQMELPFQNVSVSTVDAQ